MSYDVQALRDRFPALREGAAHFDGPGGSQVPDAVGRAVAEALTSATANRGSVTRAERRAEGTVLAARQAVADLIGGRPEGVVFGRSMTALTYDMARTLGRSWRTGDEVIVTRLDHDANIRPWVQAASAAGATVRWAEFDPDSGELTVDHVAGLISGRTRLVAVTGASNLIGTRPDVAAIAAAGRAAGALVYVDGVHLTPHSPVDTAALGADFYACSPYKWMGPHLGVLAADPALLEQLHPDKLLPSTDAVPERFELGTLPYELLAGVTAAVDFIAGIAPGALSGGDRRPRVTASLRAVEQHEAALLQRVEDGLAGLPGVRVHGRPGRRTPTLLLTFASAEAAEVSRALGARGVNAPASHFYAIEASRRLGLGDAGGLRIGLAPYNDAGDVDRLLEALGDVLSSLLATAPGRRSVSSGAPCASRHRCRPG